MTQRTYPETAELLPCPFCGGEEITIHNLRKEMYWASCKSCGLEAPSETGVTGDDAIQYWNTRAAHAQCVPRATVRDVRKVAADAIRTFCQSLGQGAVTISSDGVERIYYAGISLDALSVAVALALSAPLQQPPAAPDAWFFELATARNDDTGEYANWVPRLTFDRAAVPAGSIRNMRPLYAQPPAGNAAVEALLSELEPLTDDWSNNWSGGRARHEVVTYVQARIARFLKEARAALTRPTDGGAS